MRSSARARGPTSSRCRRKQRNKIHPYTRKWAEGGARLSGTEVMRGFNQSMELRRLAALLFGRIDYIVSPTAPIPAFAAERASPGDDPERPFEHICFTGAVEFHRAARGVDQRRLHHVGPADRRTDHRPPLRRSWRAETREGLGNRTRADHQLAEAAECMIRRNASVKCHPGSREAAIRDP
jgi:hypothetical protein